MGNSKRLAAREKNRRRKSNSFKKLPPLHWRDRVIYGSVAALAVLAALGWLPSFLLSVRLALKKEGIFACVHRCGWLYLPFGLLSGFLAAAAVGMASARTPLLGIPGYTYGREGGHRATDRPLLRRQEKATAKEMRFTRLCLGAFAAVLLTTMAMAALSFPGRWEFRREGIVKVSVVNQEEETIGWNRVESYCIKTYSYSPGKYSSTTHSNVEFVLTEKDGMVWTIKSDKFQDLDAMLALDAMLTERGCSRTIQVNQEDWQRIQDQCPAETVEIFAQLLGIS